MWPSNTQMRQDRRTVACRVIVTWSTVTLNHTDSPPPSPNDSAPLQLCSHISQYTAACRQAWLINLRTTSATYRAEAGCRSKLTCSGPVLFSDLFSLSYLFCISVSACDSSQDSNQCDWSLEMKKLLIDIGFSSPRRFLRLSICCLCV